MLERGPWGSWLVTGMKLPMYKALLGGLNSESQKEGTFRMEERGPAIGVQAPKSSHCTPLLGGVRPMCP